MGVIGYSIGVIGASLAIALSAFGVAQAMARQPEIADRVFTVFIMSSAFAEALALIGFVVALVVR
ncbi:ATPase [Collinsella sp. zg1085]|uniref:ATPase n=1 Tax=Collinsella sp. zg1085 TaxID=2844380 RepID=UPI001C0C16BC|nr:ATPase [Collinsella sp. zg1085]QWT17725.1 ATPase [Collinsella sp. zg1085]